MFLMKSNPILNEIPCFRFKTLVLQPAPWAFGVMETPQLFQGYVALIWRQNLSQNVPHGLIVWNPTKFHQNSTWPSHLMSCVVFCLVKSDTSWQLHIFPCGRAPRAPSRETHYDARWVKKHTKQNSSDKKMWQCVNVPVPQRAPRAARKKTH